MTASEAFVGQAVKQGLLLPLCPACRGGASGTCECPTCMPDASRGCDLCGGRGHDGSPAGVLMAVVRYVPIRFAHSGQAETIVDHTRVAVEIRSGTPHRSKQVFQCPHDGTPDGMARAALDVWVQATDALPLQGA